MGLIARIPAKGLSGTATRPPHGHRPEIDGLRAVAVSIVIIQHFAPALLPSGFLGVDVFFVISGYVITRALVAAARPGERLGDFLLDFYSRRVKRLIPALALCVLVTGVLISLFNPAPIASIRTGIAALFGLSNLYLLKQSVDYFGDAASLNAFTHTWSLGVEEQFYVVFPLLLWFAGLNQAFASGTKKTLTVVLVLSSVSAGVYVVLKTTQPMFAYLLMPTRIWELGAGAALALWGSNSRTFLPLQRTSLSVVLAALILLTLLPANASLYTTPAAAILTLALLAKVEQAGKSDPLLASPAFVHVGRISYSLYLWHWSVLAISRWTVGVHPWTIPFQIALMVLMAELSFRYVEHPLRRAAWSTCRVATLGYGVALVMAVSFALFVVSQPLAGHTFVGRSPALSSTGAASLAQNYEMANGHSWQGQACVLSDNADVGKDIPLKDCTLGRFDGAHRRVLVLGNSFSASLVAAFDELVTHDDHSVTILSSWGAAAVPEIPSQGAWKKANDYYWSSVVPAFISKLRAGDLVLLANDMHEFSPKEPNSDSMIKLGQLEVGLSKLSATLRERGIGLAVIHGNPFVRDAQCDPATAIDQWFAPFGTPCKFYTRQETLSRRIRLDRVLTTLRDSGQLAVVDLMDLYCPGDICSYEGAGGVPLYRDAFSHPSVEAARLSSRAIRELVLKTARNQP